jgi:phosphotriesterase-related protein
MILKCSIESNTAEFGAGVASDEYSSPKIQKCRIRANRAMKNGGAINTSGLEQQEGPIIIDCKISNNQASNGGAIYCDRSNTTVSNSILSGNIATNSGGAIYCWQSAPSFINCTFDNNHAQNLGGAFTGTGWRGEVLFKNCIIWDNSARMGDAIARMLPNITGSPSVRITHCCIPLDTDALSPGTSNGWSVEDNNIDVDPLFVDPGYWAHIEDPNVVVEPNDPNAIWVDGDYHLKSQAGRWDAVSESWVVDDVTSPCIDAGDPNSPVGDEPEPNGGRINMGAYGGTAEASKSASTWWFETTQGAIAAEGLGVILPHEHIFTDLRGPATRGYGQADAADVVRVMAPLLEEAKDKGVGLLLECSSIGVGRNVSILSEVSKASGLPVVVPTGVYGRANFAPVEHRNMSEDELTELFISEIREGIDGTGIKAGFIKIATGGGNMNALEEKILRAAGRAAHETGAAVASHTTVSSNVTKQADILESISMAIRFIWVHAQSVNNRSLYRQLMERGVFIEFDSLGWNPGQDSTFISAIKDLLAAGFGEQILLSHDAGWYQPGEQNGGSQMPYTYLIETFIPKLRDNAVDDETIRMITEENPIRAFGFNQDVKP